MAKQEIHAESLLGRRVHAQNGRVIGRLEDIRVKIESRGAFVEEFVTGGYGVLERMAGVSIGRAILKAFGARRKKASYRIPWDKLDLSDPKRPTLLCQISELRTVN